MFNLCRQTRKTNQAERRLPSISCSRDEWLQDHCTIVPRGGLLSCSHFADEETEIQRAEGRARAGGQTGRIKARWTQISLVGASLLCTRGTFLQLPPHTGMQSQKLSQGVACSNPQPQTRGGLPGLAQPAAACGVAREVLGSTPCHHSGAQAPSISWLLCPPRGPQGGPQWGV